MTYSKRTRHEVQRTPSTNLMLMLKWGNEDKNPSLMAAIKKELSLRGYIRPEGAWPAKSVRYSFEVIDTGRGFVYRVLCDDEVHHVSESVWSTKEDATIAAKRAVKRHIVL